MYKKIFFASTVFFLTLTFLYAQTERILEADGSAEKEQSYSETVKQESAPQTQAITGTAAEKGTETAENSAETELLESVKPENTQSAASGSASEKSVKLSGTEEAPLLHGRDAQFTIVEIRYVISGLTKKTPLLKAVPIEKNKIFPSKKEFDAYLEALNLGFRNLRTLESHSIETEYLPEKDGVVPTVLTIYTKDTWNIIALPYPRFDSNSGLQLKVKIKDYNFFGFMKVLNADLVFEMDENEKKAFSTALDFAIPFKAGPIDLTWDIKTGITFKENQRPEFELSTGLDAAYRYKNVTLHAGTVFGLNVYSAKEPKTPFQKTPSEEKNSLQSKQGQSSYYFTNTFYLYMPVSIYKTQNAGTLSWTPHFSVGGSWNFGTLAEDRLKGLNIKLSHALSMGQVNWHGNFRHGYSFSADNGYKYNTYKKRTDISVSASGMGFYSFLNRIGIYGNVYFFYNLFGQTSKTAGENLRGILDKRLYTDTAITFNFDLPIKIGAFKFEEITGIKWTRYLGFELHIVPFLDIALTHDTEKDSYFNPKHGWYTGGIEFIVYPIKMRSIYGRISIGKDLREIKSFGDLFSFGKAAARDGQPTTEIFIGIGLHY